MRRVDSIANVTECNAKYYAIQGHPRSVYVGNLWSDPGSPHGSLMGKKVEGVHSGRTIKIIGHVGQLGKTGSTYGLRFLLADLMPELERCMTGLEYRVHIIGGGEVVPALRNRLNHPRIVVQGFVEDLDAELESSDVYLLLNNAGRYQAAYTRHMVAWSQGLCMVVHSKSRHAIPEIAHRENALVGESATEIARLIRQAVTEPELNRQVRRGGRLTYEKHFTPRAVAQALAEEIRCLIPQSGKRG
jgi:glycosyltransferase involved in cell wall biosynthesis